ncbi:hypothetical protein CHS0354_011196 [Potamilus streckersoni]|uniref:Uncharacterized protein n=1 Tax=Potamilus streckersoni TaxID=2493646 RepID=A0AAE0T1Z7_9BIVA|nr:hypothetical protein CHS0354_011196 [Potamilus streckersoni]
MVSDLSDCQPDKINFLIVYDDHTHPGYVKLQYVDILPDNNPESVFLREAENFTVDLNDRVVLPNQYGREIAPGEVYSDTAKLFEFLQARKRETSTGCVGKYNIPDEHSHNCYTEGQN